MTASRKSLILLFIGAFAVSAAATDYYVAMTGNDSDDGSAATPFATIDAAVTNATDASDVIHVYGLDMLLLLLALLSFLRRVFLEFFLCQL